MMDLCYVNSFIILSQLFCALILQVHSCSYEEPCFGGRPADTNYCCPLPQGASCDPGNGELGTCDTELGYTCTNYTCQGPYGLIASNIGYRTVSFSWTKQLPDDYNGEFSLLWTTNFSHPLSLWRSKQVGDVPRADQRELALGTLYFFRVGLLQDAENRTYNSLSEVVMVDILDRCEHNNTMFEIGDTVQIACEAICTCHSGGEFVCADVCDSEINMEQSPNVTCRRVPSAERSPDCCSNFECVQEDCTKAGIDYKHNTTYESDCTICNCMNGSLTCWQRFECTPPEDLNCQPVLQSEPRVGECCPKYYCPKDCDEGNVTYLHGDRVTRGCNQRCHCKNGVVSCEDICEPMSLVPSIDCPYPILSYSTTETDPICPSKECRETPQTCSMDIVPHDIGSWFIDSSCQTCYCHSQSAMECLPGCVDDVSDIPSTPLCPEPQFVHLDGDCCPQVWCEGFNPNADLLLNSVKEVSVYWSDEDSVLVQFRVPLQEQLEGDLEGYEVYYSNTSGHFQSVFIEKDDVGSVVNTTWFMESKNMFTNNTVSTNTSFVVPITGLLPSQTYFFRVKVRLGVGHFDQRPTGEPNDDGQEFIPDVPRTPFSPTVVAKSLVSYKCHIKGNSILHGEQFQAGCDYMCTCLYGKLTCNPVCQTTSEICPKSTQEITSDKCCGKTKCFGKPGCCPYRNTTIEDGEIVRERCEQFCQCKNGSVHCWPVCSTLTPPRLGCQRVYHEDRCCPTFECPSEKRPPSSVIATLLLKLTGVCPDKSNFTSDVIYAIIDIFQSKWLCSGVRAGNPIQLCDERQFSVICPRFSASVREKRDTRGPSISVLIKVEAINGLSTPDVNRLHTDLSLFVERVQMSMIDLDRVDIDGVTYPITSDLHLTHKSIQCQPGYLPYRNGCMAGHVISLNKSAAYHVVLKTTDVTENTATLQWKGLPHKELTYLDEIMLEYRDISLNTSWISTHKLHSSTSQYVLESLKPATLYVVRLILLTTSLGTNKFTASSTVFQTQHSTVQVVNRPEIIDMDVSSTSVKIRWRLVSSSFNRRTFIAFKKMPKDDSVTDFQRTPSLFPLETEFTLYGLTPDTIYKVKVGVVLANETTVFSLIADLRTKPFQGEDKQSDMDASHNEVIYGISAVAILAVIVLVAIFICVFRKGRRSSRLSTSSSENNFENKMFDMDSESNKS